LLVCFSVIRHPTCAPPYWSSLPRCPLPCLPTRRSSDLGHLVPYGPVCLRYVECGFSHQDPIQAVPLHEFPCGRAIGHLGQGHGMVCWSLLCAPTSGNPRVQWALGCSSPGPCERGVRGIG